MSYATSQVGQSLHHSEGTSGGQAKPFATFESAAVARDLMEKLLTEHPDLCGHFVSGGRITGALAALRDLPKRSDLVAVGYELFEGTLTTLTKTKRAGANAGAMRVALGFDIYTPENV